MLLRISLIIAILAGGASLYFSHVKVAEKIKTLTAERDTAQTAEQTARSDEQKAKNAQRTAEQQRDQANKDLAKSQEALEATVKERDLQKKRGDKLDQDLTNVKRERNEAQQQLAAWKELGILPEQIKAMISELKATRDERDTFAGENKILNRRINQLESRLSRYEGPNEVTLPSGLKGNVIAVDPKYNFVVLNIGENQGVRENGQLLVNRNGRLIAKLQITRVQPNQSIANILPESKQGDVMEGDQVIIK